MSLSSQASSETQVQQLLEAAEKDCRHQYTDARFRDAVLQQLLQAASVESVRLWDVREQNDPVCVGECGRAATHPDLAELRATVPGVVDVTPYRDSDTASAGSRLLTSAEVIDSICVVLEVVGGDVSAARVLIEPLCEVLADLQRRLLLGKMVSRERQLLRASDLISLLHADLDRNRVVNTLASDTASVFNCRRVTICRRVSSGRWKVAAATSVSEPNDRADAVRQIERLVENTEQEAITASDTDTPDFALQAPQFTPAVDDEGPCIVRPLTRTGRWQNGRWVMVMHLTESQQLDAATFGWVCRHAAVALENSDRLAESTWAAKLRRIPTVLFARQPLIALFVVMAALGMFLAGSTDFRIEAFGQVVPSQRIRVFTPDAGIIDAIHVKDGDSVTPGQELFRLRNDEVELEFETVSGDLAATQARLSALTSMRGTGSTERNALLSAEEAELSVQVQALQKQAEIIEQRRRALIVTAKLKGRVYGDFLREHLLGRPVQRAQFLFDLADSNARWRLELKVPETDVRHVLKAAREADSPLTIEYMMETSPEVSLQTTVQEIGSTVDLDEQRQLTTRVTAELLDSPAGVQRPGAGVIAYIHCGQASRAWVYFRRVVEFVERKVF